MNEDIIITLNNGESYKILAKSTLESKQYYFCVLLNSLEEETDTYRFFEVINKDGNEVIKLIQDESFIQQLLVLFAADYAHIADSLGGVN